MNKWCKDYNSAGDHVYSHNLSSPIWSRCIFILIRFLSRSIWENILFPTHILSEGKQHTCHKKWITTALVIMFIVFNCQVRYEPRLRGYFCNKHQHCTPMELSEMFQLSFMSVCSYYFFILFFWECRNKRHNHAKLYRCPLTWWVPSLLLGVCLLHLFSKTCTSRPNKLRPFINVTTI